MASGARPALPKRGSTPDQLDPVAASSTPITPDPPTRSRINDSPASVDPEAIDELRKRFIARGIDAETAQAMAEQQVLDNKQGVLDEMDAPQREREAREAAAAAPVAPAEPSVSPERIREAGYMLKAEPGPTSVRGGGKVAQGQTFDKMSEAIGYMTRTPVTDENRRQAYPDAAYMPSQRDIDMAARGFFPVPADDGSVSYSVGTGRDPQYKQDLGRRGIPGAPGRLGPRADLEEEDPSQPGFTLTPVRGPTGTNYIYKQNDAAQKQQAGYMDRQQVSRIARVTGLDENELSAMTPEQRTMALNRSRSQDFNARNSTWKAQAMLAGGRPTGGIGGSKALTNALLSLPADQRDDAMRYMLPGGALSASVDARQLDQAAALAGKSILGAFASNPGAIAMQQTQQTAAESQLPVEAHADVERKRNKGVLPASSAAGQRMLKQIGEDKIGPYATVSEVDDAVQAAVDAGVDRKDAETYYAPRRRSFTQWAGFGGSPPAAPPASGGGGI
jgi:hypothetical protein